jgi:hypothetical protein
VEENEPLFCVWRQHVAVNEDGGKALPSVGADAGEEGGRMTGGKGEGEEGGRMTGGKGEGEEGGRMTGGKGEGEEASHSRR